MADYRRCVPAAVDLAAPRAHWRLWQRCMEGKEPAESLPTKDREDLVWQLHERHWSDKEIADHTRMTLYTTVRIRERLGLAAQQPAATAAS